MRFLEHSGLNKLTVLLSNLDAGDRILNGKLELFTCSEKDQDENDLSARIDREVCISPVWLSRSPIGPIQRQDVRQLLVNLISTMNQCFPDYDFSSLTPDNLHKERNFADVYSNINYHISNIVERVYPNFLQDLWDNIRDAVNINNVSVYSYRITGDDESNPFSDEGCLFAFDYFFYDDMMQRILFFACTTKCKTIIDTSDTPQKFDTDSEYESDKDIDYDHEYNQEYCLESDSTEF
ncbi:hypothetical protein ACR3K2_24520 [Cryptosporidium serpentis]